MATPLANNFSSERIYTADLFFELSPDLLCIAGYDGYFKRLNPAVSKLLGYTDEELYAKPIDEFVYIDDRNITSAYRTKLLKNIPLLNFDNRYVKKNGEIVWLSWTSVPLHSDELIYAIAKNITHKKQLENDRNLLLGQITQINNQLKQSSYTTSHDLRSPVNNMLSVFSFLDTTKISDPETLELIGLLKSTTEGLKNTLNNCIDGLITDNLTVDTDDVELDDCLNAVISSVKSLIETSDAVIHSDFSEAVKVNFNRRNMESIFLNLITNSIKYAKPQNKPDIHIFTRQTQGCTQLIFADKGMGFDMEKVKDNIFGFQQQFHHNSDSKGIGLYLVYNQVTQQGGTITLQSKPNEGATFTITFKEQAPVI